MPLKKKPVFVTPFSSQTTTYQGIERPVAEKEQAQTPAGTFRFPVSSSKMAKIQHVTPMTKNKIKRGLSKVLDTFPQGMDPTSPAWTFLAVSQTTSVADNGQDRDREEEPVINEYITNDDTEIDENDPETEQTSENNDFEEETSYDYIASPAESPCLIEKNITTRGHKKLVTESIKQEVLKTIYKMHQEIMDIQERRNKLALELREEVFQHSSKERRIMSKDSSDPHFQTQAQKEAAERSW